MKKQISISLAAIISCCASVKANAQEQKDLYASFNYGVGIAEI